MVDSSENGAKPPGVTASHSRAGKTRQTGVSCGAVRGFPPFSRNRLAVPAGFPRSRVPSRIRLALPAGFPRSRGPSRTRPPPAIERWEEKRWHVQLLHTRGEKAHNRVHCVPFRRFRTNSHRTPSFTNYTGMTSSTSAPVPGRHQLPKRTELQLCLSAVFWPPTPHKPQDS